MSIPTSLIVVFLVAAWLAVLVPMVARRREPVPETEADGSTFRVLRRASVSVRRRPKLARRDELEEDDLMDDQGTDDASEAEDLHEELLDPDETADDIEDDEYDGYDGYDEYEEVAEPIRAGALRGSVQAPSGVRGPFSPQANSDDEDVHVSDAYVADVRRPEPLPERRFDQDHDVDSAHLRPVPRRSGRGGYDPDAAEIARAYRYSRRRRVAVVLLVAAIVFSLAAYFVKPILWSGTAVFGLLLVAYLGYLRRQVHIEADIRERRLARLARARQIRPEYPIGHPDLPVDVAPFAPAMSQVPPSGNRRGREIVDLEDDDPSFDDLDYYQPLTYRRASGQ